MRKGEAVDVLISSHPEAEQLRKEGKTVEGSQAVIARVGIGLFVRKGDPKPEIGTADAFVRTLANAKVIAYADPKLGGSASILVAELLKSLDKTGSIAARTRLVPPAKPLVDLVAAGGVDFAFEQRHRSSSMHASTMQARCRRRISATPTMWRVWSRRAGRARRTRRCSPSCRRTMQRRSGAQGDSNRADDAPRCICRIARL